MVPLIMVNVFLIMGVSFLGFFLFETYESIKDLKRFDLLVTFLVSIVQMTLFVIAYYTAFAIANWIIVEEARFIVTILVSLELYGMLNTLFTYVMDLFNKEEE